MSKVEVNQVTQQCGTTLTVGGGACKTAVVDATTVTLGRCGGTVSLASGATQTGFGRTGTVDWQTGDIKTAAFIPATGKGYFVNTTGGAVTVNLPAGSAGDIIGLKDYANTWDSYAVTLNPNGVDKIGGGTSQDPTLTSEGGAVLLVYVDGTQGWLTTQESVTSSPSGIENFVVATGGNAITTSGDYKTHVFTGPGTFAVSSLATSAANDVVDYVVVGGGGATWANPSANTGGGGAGGVRLANSLGDIPAPSMSPLIAPAGITVSATPYSITVGAGGVSPPVAGVAPNGSVSTFDSITSAGGGGGRSSIGIGGPGASGGGGSQGPTPTSGYAGGTGNVPPTSPAQGNPGGAGYDGISVSCNGGGGGGAGVAGTNAGPGQGGNGGNGTFIACATFGPTAPSYGTPGPSAGRWFGGGGGGASYAPGTQGTGGAGGGGATNMPSAGDSGTINTGGGSGVYAGGGGSGIVIIRYKFQ